MKGRILKTEFKILRKFPIAIIANYHIVNNLKQHKSFILQFWRSEVKNGPVFLWRLEDLLDFPSSSAYLEVLSSIFKAL